jgi:hypothetical protein
MTNQEKFRFVATLVDEAYRPPQKRPMMQKIRRAAMAPVAAVKDYGNALDPELPRPRQLIGASIARVNPILGYAAQKFFDTQMYNKMKSKVTGQE